MAINLLPVELAPKGSAIKVAGYLRTAVTILGMILLLFILGVVTIFIINFLQLRNLSTVTDALKTQISSLETTEQKFFLVKDRLKYAKEISLSSAGQKNLQKMSTVLSTLPTDVTLTQAEVAKDKFAMSIKTVNSASLVSFMSGIVTSPDFGKINLVSFTFSPTSGYSAGLEFYP